MSTISQSPKVNAARTLNIRNVNLLIAAILVLALAVIVVSAVAPAARPIDRSAYMLYRQGEWASVPISVSNAEAYQLFRQGEWASVNVPENAGVDLTAYHLSERSSTDPNAGLTAFLLSERTLIEPKTGLQIFFDSERTMVPAPFTQYQLSEWFGK